MNNNLKTNSGWIVATFSLLALFLMSVTYPSGINSTDAANQEITSENISSEPFIGQVIMFGGNFAPRGWAFCDGQLLSINQNQSLFSILGTTYGGDGRTTFGLPDLRGRVPLHEGTGPGLANYRLGQKGGTENVSFKKMPTQKGNNKNAAKGNNKTSNMQPYTTVSFIIALTGTYPSRS